MRKRRFVLFVVAAVALTALPMAVAGADPGPALTPADVTETVARGGDFDVIKTVHTPELPPVLDVCLIVDNSGSYFDDLPNIKTLAPDIWDDIVSGGVSDLQMGLATFVDFPISPWGSSVTGDYAYQLEQDLTSSKATWTAAVDGMTLKFGGDGPESQYEALFQVATGAGNDIPGDVGDVAPGGQCNFRAAATKVAILTTDASFHNAGDAGPFPYPGPSAAATTAALVAGDIVVIGLKAPGAGGELDALAAATGGTTVATTSSSSDIATAILSALMAIEVEVSMTSNCATETGGAITTSFAPASQTVTSGEDAVFTETITVAGDADPGVYECEDWALIDGQAMVDEAGATIVESKTITVVAPEIDIKPGSDPNSINLKNKNGVIPVGLLGSDTFDVTTVDVTTLVFEGASPDHDLTDGVVYAAHLQDVNDDGFLDLVSHYRAQETGLTGASTEGCLDFTADSVDFTACDAVRIVKS